MKKIFQEFGRSFINFGLSKTNCITLWVNHSFLIIFTKNPMIIIFKANFVP